MVNDHFYDVMSESDEEPFTILMERDKKNKKEPNHKIKNHIFPSKKEEIHVANRYNKDSDYYPH